ncbi:Beta-1-3-N-Acetylglucosaminyltransferase family protein [Striga hermonthica]|uniref:Beta-1-3-N-Acetylglucosaminyltransferase family protein n=1 Tax=Striga hermonthica TaxID=68872 RepID=A0A9N7MSK6_STRHE|nr:Beta-1-3-N-Acetylglucosaminyltransferase family protein [Striga hermonthica]
MGQETTITLCFIALFCFLNQGLCSAQTSLCSAKTFKIDVISIGKSEWKVDITNTCVCTSLGLKLSCPDFNPIVDVDPSIISKYDDTHCLVNGGSPLHGGETFSFTYVGYDKAHFTLFDFMVACS